MMYPVSVEWTNNGPITIHGATLYAESEPLKKIPPSTRLSIYKKMLKVYQQDTDGCSGFCIVLGNFSTPKTGDYDIEQFPELMEYEPRRHGPYWWARGTRGKNIRMAVLEEIIKAMSKKKKK